MRPLRLAEVAAFADGRLHAGAAAAEPLVQRVQIDSRALKPGDLFVCLRGERFDGHDFAAAAEAAGAAALLVDRALPLALPQVVCADTTRALGRLAAGLAAERRTRVFGLTGSNGKTSVKTLLAGILARVGSAYATPGNLNNEIGVPLSVLNQPEDAEFAVYEMGAGAPGDIEWLARIGRPRYSLVNNIGPAHLERMGSLLGIAETKGAIYRELPVDGVAVINADDAFAPLFAQMAGARRILRFGLEHGAEISAGRIHADAGGSRFELRSPAGAIGLRLPLPGRHSVMNALAAAGLALAAGIDLVQIAEGLEQAQGVPGRLSARAHPSGAQIIDDSYNANPGSVEAAIDTLAGGCAEARWLVLGDMRELGPQALELHAAIGRRARAAGIARLFTVGEHAAAAAHAFGAGAQHFDTQQALIEALRPGLAEGLQVLIKGSRGSAMERVVAALFDASPAAAGHPQGGPHAA
jgi:UDP-N-acetylmuramoyl-tripeptide--D-alanyl-D-alanine ligase